MNVRPFYFLFFKTFCFNVTALTYWIEQENFMRLKTNNNNKSAACDCRAFVLHPGFQSSRRSFDFQEAQTWNVSAVTGRGKRNSLERTDRGNVLPPGAGPHLVRPGSSTTDRVPSGRDLKSFASRLSTFCSRTSTSRSTSRSCVEHTHLSHCKKVRAS